MTLILPVHLEFTAFYGLNPPLIAQIITAHLNKLPEYQEAFQAIKTLHYSSAQIPKPSAENKITAASKTQILMDYYLNLILILN